MRRQCMCEETRQNRLRHRFAKAFVRALQSDGLLIVIKMAREDTPRCFINLTENRASVCFRQRRLRAAPRMNNRGGSAVRMPRGRAVALAAARLCYQEARIETTLLRASPIDVAQNVAHCCISRRRFSNRSERL